MKITLLLITMFVFVLDVQAKPQNTFIFDFKHTADSNTILHKNYIKNIEFYRTKHVK